VIECFLASIHFVYMIITINPPPAKVMIDRIWVFRTAVTCFQRWTEENIQKKPYGFLGNVANRLCIIWGYISYWLAHDNNYSPHMLFWNKNSGVSSHGKSVFNFIFGYSMDTSNKQILSAVDTQSNIQLT
jgi:hypothetical protein